MDESVYTIRQYLQGKVRNITIPDEAMQSICIDAGVYADTPIVDTTIKERELSLAWLYVWVAGSPTQTGSSREADADWEHTEGGERMSANVLKQYLAMANDIFAKYKLPTVGGDKWGFVGLGIRNSRNYRLR